MAGPMVAGMAAQTLAWAGDHTRAIEMLAQLVKVPFGPSYGDLQLSPAWDDLRAKPEFAKLVNEAASLARDGDANAQR